MKVGKIERKEKDKLKKKRNSDREGKRKRESEKKWIKTDEKDRQRNKRDGIEYLIDLFISCSGTQGEKRAGYPVPRKEDFLFVLFFIAFRGILLRKRETKDKI